MNEGKILIPEYHIIREIDFLGRKISEEVSDDEIPVFLGVLNGAFMFTAELVKHMRQDILVDFVRVGSYVSNKQGNLSLTSEPKLNLNEKIIYIIEDIVDSGNTIEFLKNYLTSLNVKSIKVVSLIKRKNDNRDIIDYYAVEIGDEYIWGFGLDNNELKRNYRNIYTYK